MNTPDFHEQIKAARALLDAIERGRDIEWNYGSKDKPDWAEVPRVKVLDALDKYRVKSPPRFYTVEELVEKGIRFLYLDYKVYMVLLLMLKENTITVSQLPNLPSPSSFPPSWFAEQGYQWSANGTNWNNFTKEDQ
jgi:hypothetical protein